MVKDACHLCASPGVKYTAMGLNDCVGCGTSPIEDLVNYLALRSLGKLTWTPFENATITYQRSPYHTRLSFGEWLILFQLTVLGLP